MASTGLLRWVLLIAVLAIVVAGGAFVLGSGRTGVTGTQTNQQGVSHVLFSLGQTPRLLGPGITMNYTLTLVPGAGAIGNATLSSSAPPGLSVRFNPSAVTLSGNNAAVDVSVSAARSIGPGVYDIGFKVTWRGGSTNLTFKFTVVQHMILIRGGGSPGPGGFDPLFLGVHPGETVTWISLDAGSDEFAGLRAIRIVELNDTSPTLSLYSTWSYTFAQSGVYHFQDPINAPYVPEGTIVVS